jgi:hypothetical protein
MSIKRKVTKKEFLIGKRIYLRPFSKNDLSYVQKWSNDPEIRKLTGEVAPMKRAEAEKSYKSSALTRSVYGLQ